MSKGYEQTSSKKATTNGSCLCEKTLILIVIREIYIKVTIFFLMAKIGTYLYLCLYLYLWS